MSATRSAVKVVVRFRSTARFAQDNIQIDGENNKITLIAEDDSSHGESKDGLNNKTNTFRFGYDSVLHNAGQNTVYETYANSVVMGCLDGLNGTIFSYGQTGAGKTFTMVGDTKVYAHRGVMPRAVGFLSLFPTVISSRLEQTHVSTRNCSLLISSRRLSLERRSTSIR